MKNNEEDIKNSEAEIKNAELKSEMMKAMLLLRGVHFQHYKRPGLDVSMPAFILLQKLQMREENNETGGAWLSEMKDHLCVSKAAVSQMLGSLEKRGMVTRRVDPENRRTVIVKLTDKGAGVIACFENEFDTLYDTRHGRKRQVHCR